MNKKQLVVLIALSTMQSTSAILKTLDSNTVGPDDEAAKALDAAIVALQVYLTNG